MVGVQSVKAQVNCVFTASQIVGCPPLVVNFQDQSTGGPTSFYWDFDNSNTSTVQNPTATFFQPGVYNIKHVVSNGSSTDSQTLQIRVFQPATPNFTALNRYGCVGGNCHTVNFTNLTIPGEAPVVEYVWNFGDGSQPVQTYNAQRCFTQAGRFNITLIARDSNNCVSNTTLNSYVITGNYPNASFTPSLTQSCTSPRTVNFSNTSTSTNGPLTYNWQFGSGSSSSQQNPAQIFFTGIYDPFLVVRDTLGCTDTAFSHIEITQVIAGFRAASTNACNGVAMQFTDTSNFASSWLWNFGDGSTSTLQNPTHVYNANGSYTVTLTVTYNGCTDTRTQTSYINVTDPINFQISANSTSACNAPFNVSFTNNAIGASSVSWNFGDGGSSTLQNPSHTYTANGVYTVTSTVTNSSGCANTVTLTNRINIHNIAASFTIDSANGCAPLRVRFVGQATSNVPVTTYQYFYGDGTNSTTNNLNQTHIYTISGTYTPFLVITNQQGCKDTFYYPTPINVGVTPIANFTGTPLSICVNQSVAFTNLSTNTTTATQYLWDFGDGQTSTLAAPSHAYDEPGTFTVTLTATNQGCSNTISRVNYIVVNEPDAKFDFNFDCSNPTTVAFADSSVGANSWLWRFGDGATSTQQNPVHTYSTQNNYTVTLIVTNFASGCVDSVRRTIPIGNPSALFTADTTSGCFPLRVRFTDNSVFASSWLWIFGDGTTSSAQNPAHTYADTGRFTVRLVINPGLPCTDTITRVNYITAYGVKVNFGAIPTSGCTPLVVQFRDSSTSFLGTITNRQWYFDVLDSSNQISPSYTFANAGTYNIRLRVTDSNGCSAARTRNNYIRAFHPNANFVSDTVVCPGEAVRFTNQSTSSNTYLWLFGDGTSSTQQNPSHVYNAVGTYTVTLIARSTQGCTDTIRKINYIDVDTPIVDFYPTSTFAPCPPFTVRFINTSNRNDLNWYWSFGDGDTSTVSDPLHVYFFPGYYTVSLIGWNASGCSDTIVYPDLIQVLGPIGNFTVVPNQGCVPLDVTISGTVQSTTSIVADLGDGTILTGTTNIAHTYTQARNYIPSFTLTDSNGCVVTYPLDTVIVGIIPYPNLNDTTVCKGNYVQFNLPLGDHFQWTSDLSPSYLSCDTCRNPLSTAIDTITYYVVASTDIGCVARDTVRVYVDALPQIQPGALYRICPGESIQLNAGNVSAATWTPGIYMSDSNAVSPTVTPPDSMIYRVTGVNATGCSVSKIVRVFVIDRVIADVNPTDTLLCEGNTIQLNVIVTQASYNDTNFIWRPIQYLTPPTSPNPIVNAPPGVYNYQVITSSQTCIPDTDYVRIVIAAKPRIDAGDDQTVTEGTNIQIHASSPDNVFYQWSNYVDSLGCNDCRITNLTATQPQIIYMTATNQFGCTAYDSVIVKIVGCDPSAVFVPNTFTPNNDDLNDKLFVRGVGLRKLDYLMIFDRWGQLMFETRDLSEGWDGVRNGKPADVATYVYSMKGECSNGNSVEKSGNVTLIR